MFQRKRKQTFPSAFQSSASIREDGFQLGGRQMFNGLQAGNSVEFAGDRRNVLCDRDVRTSGQFFSSLRRQHFDRVVGHNAGRAESAADPQREVTGAAALLQNSRSAREG